MEEADVQYLITKLLFNDIVSATKEKYWVLQKLKMRVPAESGELWRASWRKEPPRRALRMSRNELSSRHAGRREP